MPLFGNRLQTMQAPQHGTTYGTRQSDDRLVKAVYAPLPKCIDSRGERLSVPQKPLRSLEPILLYWKLLSVCTVAVWLAGDCSSRSCSSFSCAPHLLGRLANARLHLASLAKMQITKLLRNGPRFCLWTVTVNHELL